MKARKRKEAQKNQGSTRKTKGVMCRAIIIRSELRPRYDDYHRHHYSQRKNPSVTVRYHAGRGRQEETRVSLLQCLASGTLNSTRTAVALLGNLEDGRTTLR